MRLEDKAAEIAAVVVQLRAGKTGLTFPPDAESRVAASIVAHWGGGKQAVMDAGLKAMGEIEAEAEQRSGA